MLNRLSINSSRPENIHFHPNVSFDEKQNNQKNLNRTRRSAKLSTIEQCLFIKPVDSKSYLTNADTKVKMQSSYNSTQPTIETRFKPSSRTFQQPRFDSPIQSSKHKSDTQQFCQVYGKDILIQHQVNPTCKTNFLANHEINATLRARMLDWMVEVMESYKFTHKTYFSSVEIMDRYLTEVADSVPLSQLHILGVVSMHVATKMEEVFPLKLKTVYEKIVHKKIDKQRLMEMEIKLFNALGHKTNSWTFYDLAILKVFDQVKIDDFQTKEKLQNIISYLSKFVIYDYHLYTKYDMETLAKIIANFGAKICGLRFNSDIQLECQEDISTTYKNFKTNFKGLSNIFQFTNESIVKLVDSYFLTTKMY